MRPTSRITLWMATLVGLLALACAPAAPSPTAPPAARPTAKAEQPAAKPAASPVAKAADWQAEWERTVAAAKQEGRVVVAGLTGDSRRGILTAFHEAYPEIQVEYTGIGGRDLTPRLLAERRAGQYLWDVIIGGASTGVTSFNPQGILDPLRPMLIHPDTYADDKWFNGFDWGFMDAARQRVYGTGAYLRWMVKINRDVIPEGELTRLEHLLDPKYRGKIVMDDPRFGGTGTTDAARMLATMGEDWLRKLLTEQAVVATRDVRQLAEWVVRGSYPIGIAVAESEEVRLRREGVWGNVQTLESPDAAGAVVYPAAMAVNRAPHPNSAKLYLNWWLSREGQSRWNKTEPQNSRRLDVEANKPSALLNPGAEYFMVDREENAQFLERAQQVTREALP